MPPTGGRRGARRLPSSASISLRRRSLSRGAREGMIELSMPAVVASAQNEAGRMRRTKALYATASTPACPFSSSRICAVERIRQ